VATLDRSIGVTSTTPLFLRSILAVAAGIFVGAVAVFGVEALGHAAVPLPRGIDPVNPGTMTALPTGNLMMLLLAYLVGPTLGATIAARLAPGHPLRHAGVVAAFFVVGGIMNFRALPHPAWFVALSMVAFLSAPWLGTRLAGK